MPRIPGDPTIRVTPKSGVLSPRWGQSWGNPGADPRPVDDVERALARALAQAADAGRFDIVAQLAKELEARRLTRFPNGVPLP